jgi:hypothetical protein
VQEACNLLAIIGRSRAHAVELLGCHQAVLALVLVLEHADSYMQAHTAVALGIVAQSGGADVVVGSGALPPLQTLALLGETEQVREAATKAVLAIGMVED